MSAPSVVTRSGQRAQIQVIREFIYPIEFDPPEIPQDFGSINSSGGFNPFTGFSSSSHFAMAYQRHYGMRPTDARRPAPMRTRDQSSPKE